MTHLPNFVALLDDLAVIEVSGSDAASFLHGQLTHDITGMASDQARLAGYCTAKGRLLGSMVIWSEHRTNGATQLYALVKADIASALIKRLSMFVLRAQVVFRQSPLQVLGVTFNKSGTDKNIPSTDIMKQAAIMSAQQSTWDVVRSAAGTWISAPSATVDTARWWFAASDPQEYAEQLDTPDAKAPAPGTPAADTSSECWRAGDIAAGLPWVGTATQDFFIPQTLNFDLIDGVSFSKGCYPGQEVVARSHYRGTVKRRMAYGVVTGARDIESVTLPGADIYKAGNPDMPCGRIINAAICGDLHLLMEVQLSDLPTSAFRLGKADGPAIELLPLPYQVKTES
ncbi:folate-binding protein YgfZ [Pollutimonas nitritireducens]|uniref:Folate-binding protein YgfZ n=1 Tax=Pollutimonas nitritireducens TaxID=2045209 RepID=A0A2N4UGQ2_9BURK|nr:folate-binding protein YgfZ [Pollutimonas nitritireducens]PLC54199.1 folate-binding protein YgfZ [Pollutimonas nitritireducens]